MKELYESMPPGYYHHIYTSGSSIQRYWHSRRFKQILKRINSNANSTILDVGCGAGTLLTLIKTPYRTAIGIDFDEKQINFAKQHFKNKNKIDWQIGDITKLSIESQFDYIICSEVIEHLKPDDAVVLLWRVSKLLKPDGKLILTTPNYNSLWPFIEWFVNKLGKVNYNEQHVNKLTKGKLNAQVKTAGMKIHNISSFYVISPFLAFISTKLSDIILNIEQTFLPKMSGSVMIVEVKNELF